MSIYLSIDGESWKDFEKEGKEEARATMGENKDGSMTFTSLDLVGKEIEFKEGELKICGDLRHPTSLINFGYLNVDFHLPLDTVIEIIEFYRKKLGKLKTVIEAVK